MIPGRKKFKKAYAAQDLPGRKRHPEKPWLSAVRYGCERWVKDLHLQSVLNPPHLLLHAWRLQLPESTGIVPSRYEAPLPPHFSAALQALHMESALPD
jgi:hypothetical protein